MVLIFIEIGMTGERGGPGGKSSQVLDAYYASKVRCQIGSKLKYQERVTLEVGFGSPQCIDGI